MRPGGPLGGAGEVKAAAGGKGTKTVNIFDAHWVAFGNPWAAIESPLASLGSPLGCIFDQKSIKNALQEGFRKMNETIMKNGSKNERLWEGK